MPQPLPVAVVTGGAGGIGRSVCVRLAATCHVVVADLDEAGAAVTEAKVRESGGQARAMRVDLAEERSVDAMFEQIVAAYGRVDVLCNNAADLETAVTGDAAALHETPLDVWRRTLGVNLLGTVAVTRAALGVMLPARRGVIVNVVSIGGLRGDVVRAAYNASKAALVQFTRDVATQYGAFGIRCNAVAPGFIMTPKADEMLDDAARRHLLRHHLTTRLGQPGDIAEAVEYLASDRSGFVTGSLLVVDGGMTAHSAAYAEQRPVVKSTR